MSRYEAQQEAQYLTLERQRFAYKQFMSDELGLDDVSLDAAFDHMLHGMVYAFQAELWCHKLPGETKTETTNLRVETWDSAWQLWKFNRYKNHNRYLGWIHTKWPAKKTAVTNYQAQCTFDLDKRVLFPEYNYPKPMGSPYMRVALSQPVWSWE